MRTAFTVLLLGVFCGCAAAPAADPLLPHDSFALPSLAVQETRATVRRGMADAVKAQTDHELAIQSELRKSEDFREGVKAVAERRVADTSIEEVVNLIVGRKFQARSARGGSAAPEAAHP